MSTSERIKELLRPTGEEDLLDVNYPDPRWRITPRHAVMAVAVVIVLVVLWVVMRPAPHQPEWGDGVAEVVDVPHQVVVSVVGEVENPGLVTLDDGARVADALAKAGPLPQADLLVLNQAQPLVDGQQILVQPMGAVDPPPAELGTASATPGVMSLNSASEAELTTLPGVGQATAAAIVAHREAYGPFRTIDELTDVKGIGPAKFEALKDLVGV